MPPGQPIFGIGGCFMLGHQYAHIVKPWHKLKLEVFQLSSTDAFHATDHLQYASDEQVLEIAQFISLAPMKRIMAAVTRDTATNGEYKALLSGVVQSVSSQVVELLPHRVKRDRWFIEDSTNLLRRLIEVQVTGPTDFHLSNASDTSSGLFYIKKSRAEPGLEIADLFAYLVGLRYRRERRWRPIYDAVLAAAFPGRPDGTSGTLLLCSSPIWIEIDPDGNSKVRPPPSYELRLGFRHKPWSKRPETLDETESDDAA